MTEAERQRAIWKKLARMESAPRELAGWIPTGFRALDDALGGGFPHGGLLEFYGPVGCGKSTLALQVVAKLQAASLTCAWIDADRTFDSVYAAGLGVAVDRVPLAQPDSAEEGMEVMRALAESGAVDLIVVDSAAALVPKLELEAGIGYYSRALHSRVLSSGLRTVRKALQRSGACALFLNQARNRPSGGVSATSAGGPPLKLLSDIRLALVPTGGTRLCLRVLKNKGGGHVQGRELEWVRGAGFAESL